MRSLAMRSLLGAALVLAFCGTLSADDKKDEKTDAKKLIGRWEPKDKKLLQFTVVAEYTKGGKFIHTVTGDGPERRSEFTYTVEGNTMTLTMKFDNGRESVTRQTITALTDTDLVTTATDGVVLKFVRVKDK